MSSRELEESIEVSAVVKRQSDLFAADDQSYATGAVFDGAYRYRLWRVWRPEDANKIAPRLVCWLMLNPSTADALVLDPTVRRCVNYAKRWGYDGIDVVNLFALKSTDPGEIYKHDEPTGNGRNDRAIAEAMARCSLLVVAFGFHAAYRNRGADVYKTLVEYSKHAGYAMCLGTTADGWPRHPLYCRNDVKLQRWDPSQVKQRGRR